MNENECYLCELVKYRRTKSIRTLFNDEKSKNFENNFLNGNFHNTYINQNSIFLKTENEKADNRSNNLIIFGIDESNESANEIKRRIHDEAKIKDLLTLMGVETEIIENRRLDQKNTQIASRPLLIKLVNYDTKSIILKKARTLRDYAQFKNVSISPDYSRFKRQKIKMLIKTRIDN